MNIFKSDLGEITEITKNGEPWFIAKDICDILGIKNNRQALSLLEADEKNTVRLNDGIKGNPNKTIINESGLYELIMNSRKPEAKKFRKWITSEVLPSIRKTGKFEIPKDQIKESVKNRNILTAQWKDHGITGHNFMNLTKHVKKSSGLNKPREQLTKEERAKMSAIESIEAYKLMKSNEIGYYPLKQSVSSTIGLIDSI